MQPVINLSAKVICRETTPDGVIAYVLDGTYGPNDLLCLNLRHRYNPELEYFAISEKALTEEQTPLILTLIKNFGECSLTVPI